MHTHTFTLFIAVRGNGASENFGLIRTSPIEAEDAPGAIRALRSRYPDTYGLSDVFFVVGNGMAIVLDFDGHPTRERNVFIEDF